MTDYLPLIYSLSLSLSLSLALSLYIYISFHSSCILTYCLLMIIVYITEGQTDHYYLVLLLSLSALHWMAFSRASLLLVARAHVTLLASCFTSKNIRALMSESILRNGMWGIRNLGTSPAGSKIKINVCTLVPDKGTGGQAGEKMWYYRQDLEKILFAQAGFKFWQHDQREPKRKQRKKRKH